MYTLRIKKFRGNVILIGLVVFTPVLCLTDALAIEVSTDRADTQVKVAEEQVYDLSRVLVTPVQRQWIETAETPFSKIKIDIFDSPLSLGEQADVLETELPAGLPIKIVDLAKFTELKTKKDSRIYWRIEAILYKDTIYLLE